MKNCQGVNIETKNKYQKSQIFKKERLEVLKRFKENIFFISPNLAINTDEINKFCEK